MSVLVVTEVGHSGDFHSMSWEALFAGRQLAEALSLPLQCLVIGGSIEAQGTRQLVAVEHPLLAEYTADAFCAALKTALAELKPEYVVFPHTYQVRDYGPKLATAFNKPFLSDCTALRVDNGEAIFTRQVFQGKLQADCAFSGDGPRLLSVQSGAFPSEAPTAQPARQLAVEIEDSTVRVKPEAPYREAAGTADLSSAERIVSVGRGIKDPENIALMQELANAMGAELGASRPICDSGWLPLDRQVGSSGQTVAPKLYLALGISGAIQHVVGMKSSDVIVAVNADEAAPIFEIADYGIVADLFEIVPELLKQLKV